MSAKIDRRTTVSSNENKGLKVPRTKSLLNNRRHAENGLDQSTGEFSKQIELV
jgi:hypothetical protein